jgi:hypothetical protein
VATTDAAAGAPLPRFADPKALDRIVLPGGCRCPGSPHDEDWARFRTQLGDGEKASIGTAGWGRSLGAYFDWNAAKTALVAYATIDWNLVGLPDAKGRQATLPITFDAVNLLDGGARDAIAKAINDADRAWQGLPLDDDEDGEEGDREEGDGPEPEEPVPNESGGRSPSSSRATASATPTTR